MSKAFFAEVCAWAEETPDIRALVLVGSWARGENRADSDIDLMVLTEKQMDYVRDHGFARHFGEVKSAENEDWSWEILQLPGEAPAEEPAAYVSIRRAEKRDYESLVTRLLHQCYRNGARRIYVRDLEIPERLAPGQRYGYYTVRGLAEPEIGGKAAPDLAESGGEMPEAAKQADFMETRPAKNPFYAVDT